MAFRKEELAGYVLGRQADGQAREAGSRTLRRERHQLRFAHACHACCHACRDLMFIMLAARLLVALPARGGAYEMFVLRGGVQSRLLCTLPPTPAALL